MPRAAHYTDDPAVMALDVRDYLVGQRNLMEYGRQRAVGRVEAAKALDVAEVSESHKGYLIGEAEMALHQLQADLRLLDERIADMDAIHATLTAPPEKVG